MPAKYCNFKWQLVNPVKSSPPTIKKSNNQYPEPRARIYHATRHVHIRGKCCLSLHCSRPCQVPFIQRSDSWSEPRRSLVPGQGGGWSTHRVRGSRPVDTRTFRSFSVTPPSHLNKICCHLLSQDWTFSPGGSFCAQLCHNFIMEIFLNLMTEWNWWNYQFAAAFSIDQIRYHN